MEEKRLSPAHERSEILLSTNFLIPLLPVVGPDLYCPRPCPVTARAPSFDGSGAQRVEQGVLPDYLGTVPSGQLKASRPAIPRWMNLLEWRGIRSDGRRARLVAATQPARERGN